MYGRVFLFLMIVMACSAKRARVVPHKPPTYAQIEGMLLSVALADILGRISESATHSFLLEKVYGPSAKTVSLQTAQKSALFSQGLFYTEEMILTLMVLEVCTLARKNRWENEQILDAMARGFVYWSDATHDMHANKRKGRGALPTAVLNDLVKNVTSGKKLPARWWKLTGTSTLIHDNNSRALLSVIPIALVFYDDLARVQHLAAEQASMAYRNPMVEEAAVAMATSLVYALQRTDPVKLVKKTIAVAEKSHARLKGRIHIANPSIKRFNFTTVKENPALMFEGVRRAIKADQLSVADILRYVALIHELSPAGTEGWSKPDIIFGASLLGNESGQTTQRSATGGLLAWLADEAVAAALYIFLRYSKQPPDRQAAWHGIQEGVWTIGNSGVIAILSGSLLGAYSGGLVLPAEESALLPKLEAYDRIRAFAQYLEGLLGQPEAKVQVQEVPPLITPYSVYNIVPVAAEVLPQSNNAKI